MADDTCRLDPHAARLLHMLNAAERPDQPPLSPEDQRRSLRDLAGLAADPPPPGVACEALSIKARNGVALPVRRYTPESSTEPAPAMLYLHGGGWVAGDLDTHAGVCGALAVASGCSVFALHYRRPPEHGFPGPIHDALDALAWLQAQAGALGVEWDRVALGGDSAGANLAAACLLDPSAPKAALLLLICPILDLPCVTGSRERFGRGFFLSADRLAADARAYLQGADPADPRVSPLRAPSLSHLPLTLIHAAACDPFRDEALAYATRLGDAAVPVRFTVHPGMIHYFYALPRTIPYARQALAQIGAEVRAAFERADGRADQLSASSE